MGHLSICAAEAHLPTQKKPELVEKTHKWLMNFELVRSHENTQNIFLLHYIYLKDLKLFIN